MELSKARSRTNLLSPLGYKIFLDRFSQKDLSRETLSEGNTVLVCTDKQSGNREIGKVESINVIENVVKVSLFDLYTGEVSKIQDFQRAG